MPHMYNTPWQAPAPLVQNNPNVLGARGQASSIGNRYGRPELMPYAPLAFTAGIFSAQAKQELLGFIDTMLSIWPFSLTFIISTDSRGQGTPASISMSR